MQFTRRWAIASGAAAAGCLLTRPAAAQALLRTRYNATSPQGQAMLVKYAKAVKIMRTRIPVGDPRHWDFQWYTHWIPGPQEPWLAVELRKAQVIRKIYGLAPSPNRLLAQAMWNDCQAHGDNPNDPDQFQETYFFPWHRYFVYFFEEIVRGVLQDDSFTLPYWDYLGGTVADLSIPPEFYQNPASPLYQPNRNPWVNQGQRIDLQNPGALNLDAFEYGYYISDDGTTGFCPTFDFNPHGLVHFFTGDKTNMGSVPTAGADPVFWLHHSNVDRLWASWNGLGYANPVWDPRRRFVFADRQGRRVEVNPNGARDTVALGYVYDSYQRVAALAPAGAEPIELTAALPLELAYGVSLSPSAPTEVELVAAAAPWSRLTARQFVTLSDIDVGDGFNGAYNVYFGAPPGITPCGTDSRYYVGTFSSFNLMGHMMHHHGRPALAFDATAQAARLAAGGWSPTVAFVPTGDVAPGLRIGTVAVVAA